MKIVRRLAKGLGKGEKGFTLIELLIVVAILGILAAVIIPNVATFMQSGEKAAAQSELAIVQTAVFAHMADSGVGSIAAAGTVSSDTSALGLLVTSFLQGGTAKLNGIWAVDVTGYVSAGDYPARTTDHWDYTTVPDTWNWASGAIIVVIP